MYVRQMIEILDSVVVVQTQSLGYLEEYCSRHSNPVAHVEPCRGDCAAAQQNVEGDHDDNDEMPSETDWPGLLIFSFTRCSV
jgi:hypothetical protein